MAVILVRKPPQKPSYRRRVLLLPEAVSSDVTVAITGNSSTVAVGSLAPSVDVSVSGNSTTLSPGTLAPAISVPITGVSSSASVGSLVPSLSVALTGNSSVAGVGNLGLDISVPITGNVSTLSVGSVTPSIGGDVTVAITGVSSTFSVGSLVPSLSVPITGNVTTLAVGSVTASVPVAEQPSGGWDYYPAYQNPREKENFIEKQEALEEDLIEVEKKLKYNKDRKELKNILILENRLLSLRDELDGLKVLNALIAEQEAIELQKRILYLRNLEEMEEEESIFMLMCMMEAA